MGILCGSRAVRSLRCRAQTLRVNNLDLTSKQSINISYVSMISDYITFSVIIANYCLFYSSSSIYFFCSRRRPLCSGICSKFFPLPCPAKRSTFSTPASISSNLIFHLHITYTPSSPLTVSLENKQTTKDGQGNVSPPLQLLSNLRADICVICNQEILRSPRCQA